MNRGTTPTHTFTLPFDTSMIARARITYSQNSDAVLTKETDAITFNGNECIVKLSQDETLLFVSSRPVEIQIRVVTPAEDALVSDIMRVSVDRLLDDSGVL